MKSIAFIFLSLALSACTSIPNRYIQDESISSNGGYIIEDQDNSGIYLDVYYQSYSFAPRQDDDIQEAIAYFKELATKLAKAKGHSVKPIRRSQLKIDATRNIVDSHYSIYISGKAEYRDIE